MNYESICFRDHSHIEIPIPQNYKDCIMLIQSDLYRYYERVFGVRSIIIKTLFHPFSVNSMLVYFRLCKYKKGLLYPYARIMYSINSLLHLCQIPHKLKVGFGFYISHGICIVVNGGTIIGNNVSISQFLNIGTNHNTPAIIGDNVYIAPMVAIVENVEIGSNSRIGAGAVVTKDVQANSTFAGVPAKKISDNFNEKWHYWHSTPEK